MMSPLHVDKVSKRYDGRLVLREVSFALLQGEIFGLIGLNGAGKTTLIKIALDLIRSDGGQVMIFGEHAASLEARRDLSYLPEKFQPSRYLKGLEYLDLSLSYFGRPLDVEAARAKAAALDLDPAVLDRKVGSYSKGMGQKLGLLAAFLIGAPLLLLDEPMSGLDPRARVRLKEELLAMRAAGTTVFFSSHILADVDEICDRIAVIHEGNLLFLGTPAAFKTAYGDAVLERAFLKAIASSAQQEAA